MAIADVEAMGADGQNSIGVESVVTFVLFLLLHLSSPLELLVAVLAHH